MKQTIRVKTYSELAEFIANAMRNGYEFKNMDGTIEGGGTIVLDKQDDEIAIIIDGVLQS